MSYLCVYHNSNPKQPVKLLNYREDIVAGLSAIGVRFEYWQARQPITAQSSDGEIIAAYQADIDRLKQQCGYTAVDVLRVEEAHPQRTEHCARFLDEHTHNDDEVRFFVSGRGLFNLHVDGHVYAVLCEKGDLISVPAGTKHWFDRGENPHFTVIRVFRNPENSVAQFTGEKLAGLYPLLED